MAIDINWAVAVAIGSVFGFAMGWSAAFVVVISDQMKAKSRHHDS